MTKISEVTQNYKDKRHESKKEKKIRLIIKMFDARP